MNKNEEIQENEVILEGILTLFDPCSAQLFEIIA